MGFFIRTALKTQSVRLTISRAYSSDITASAMVYSNYGQPSQVLK